MNHKIKSEKGGYVFKKGCPNRKYRKQADRISQQGQLLQFLIHNGFDLTAKIFQKQLQDRAHEYEKITNLMNTVSDPNNTAYFSIQQFKNWISAIKSHYKGSSDSFVKLQFLLMVWFCTLGQSEEKESRDNNLKKFIQTNGGKLSQFPQLLPYFALPYIQEPKNHPYLRRIFSEQFIVQIKNMLQGSLSAPNKFKIGKSANIGKEKKNINLSQQIQWLIIVKDLIDISLHLNEKIQLLNRKLNESDMLQKTSRHLEMIQRVKQYQIVIENQKILPDFFGNQLSSQEESMRPSQLSKLIQIPDKQLFIEEKNIHEKHQAKFMKQLRSIGSINNQQQNQYEQISYPQLKSAIVNLGLIKKSEHQQFCLIYYALNERIINSKKFRKEIIREYIDNDVLCLKKSDTQIYPKKRFEMEYLKLLNSMCSFSLRQTCNHLQETGFIQMMCSFVIGNKNHFDKSKLPIQKNKENQLQKNQNIGKQEKLCQVFGILQKISTKRKIVQVMLSTEITIVLIQNFLSSFMILPSNLLTIVLGLLLNIILHRQGKEMCSKQKFKATFQKKSRERILSLFQLIIEIWTFVSKKNNSKISHDPLSYHSQLQSLLYSIFYVLLSLQQNKSIAMKVKFKQNVQKFLSKNNDEYYSKVIGQILKSLENPCPEQILQSSTSSEEQSEQEISEEDQLDDSIQKKLIWIGQQLSIIPYKDENQDIQFFLQRYYKKNIKKVEVNQFYVNASAPISNMNHDINRRKDQNLKQKMNQAPPDNNIKKNISQRYEKVAGYDPAKYQAWKKLKTSE